MSDCALEPRCETTRIEPETRDANGVENWVCSGVALASAAGGRAWEKSMLKED
jgi:hypothetical protein